MIRLLCNENGYDKGIAAFPLMSLMTQFHDNTGDFPPIKFETGHQGKEAERLTHFIWDRIMRLLLMGKELEANSLLEEFDEPPLWDDPLN